MSQQQQVSKSTWGNQRITHKGARIISRKNVVIQYGDQLLYVLERTKLYTATITLFLWHTFLCIHSTDDCWCAKWRIFFRILIDDINRIRNANWTHSISIVSLCFKRGFDFSHFSSDLSKYTKISLNITHHKMQQNLALWPSRYLDE